MYNRFRRCSCMNSRNQGIETICENQNNNTISACNSIQNECMCGFEEENNIFPDNPMLAQSYVPIQTLETTYTPCCGLKNGTIFPELVSPYEACDSIRFINYLKNRNEIGEGCNG